jgi:hypothetical protein
MSAGEDLVYARGELSADAIQSEIVKFWQVLDNQGSPVLDDELRAAGLDRAALDGVDRESAIVVHPGSSGVDPSTVVLVVSIAPSVNHVIKDLWKKIVLPRIVRRWGDDAVGEEKRSED